jgi:hypothetical protein
MASSHRRSGRLEGALEHLPDVPRVEGGRDEWSALADIWRITGGGLGSPTARWLYRTMRSAELAGEDPARVLREAVQSRDLAGARDIPGGDRRQDAAVGEHHDATAGRAMGRPSAGSR